MNLKSSLFALLLSASTILPAQAAVIDFEDVGFTPCTSAPISTRGFTFTGNDFFHCVTPAGLPTPGANNGSSFLIEGSAFLTVTHDGGVPFSLQRVDLGTSFFNATSPNLMVVTGTTVYDTIVSRTLIVTNRFSRFELTGFNDLVALNFSGLLLPDPQGGQGYFALDNLVVRVPLPGTVPLVLLGCGVLAAASRLRRPLSMPPRAAS